MKPKCLLLVVVCMIFCAESGVAQVNWNWLPGWWHHGKRGNPGYPYMPIPAWVFDTWQYKDWSERYQAEERARRIGFLQAWTENMQNGITRLNADPQTVGVTPINGALLFSETDVSVPGRLDGDVTATRFYNSKIWYGDSAEIAGGGKDHLRAYSWLGMGWDLHVGRLWSASGGKIYEAPSGMRTHFKTSSQSRYVATDGSFDVYKNDTLKTSSGLTVVFTGDPVFTIAGFRDYYGVKKIVDNKGNITSFYYNDNYLYLGVEDNGNPNGQIYCLDSAISSTGERIVYHYHADTIEHTDPTYWYYYVLLDSVEFVGYDSETLSIAYHYTRDSVDTSPFGNDFASELGNEELSDSWEWCRPAYVLNSVVFPNNDSMYYQYNDCYELISVNTPSGGSISYDYETFNYYMPSEPAQPPESGFDAKKEFTRGVKHVITDDDWSAPDTTHYERNFRSVKWPNHGKSNADSVRIIYPNKTYHALEYLSSGLKASGSGFHWEWYNGLYMDDIYARRLYDANNTLLRQNYIKTKKVSADSIAVLSHTKTNDGVKTYQYRFYMYDDYANVGLIFADGDTSITSDDQWIHRTYLMSDPEYCSFWLHESASGYITYDGISITKFYSQCGVDTLTIKRKWFPSEDSLVFSKFYEPGSDSSYGDSIYLSLDNTVDTLSEDTLAVITVWACEYSTPEAFTCSVAVYIGPELPTGGQRDDVDADSTNSYQYTNLCHLLTEEFINNDSASTSWWQKTTYSYDDTNHIVKTYTPDPPFHQDPIAEPLGVPVNLYGNLTKTEGWKDGSNSVKTEFRYDEVGNVVMSITHPSTSTAETTFSYYDPSSDPDKYNYAFPWRVVNHVSTSVESLYTRTEYDVHTGLVTKAYDANGDSTLFTYDSVGRLWKVRYPNEANHSTVITYHSYQSSSAPQAVVDSIKLDHNSDLWKVDRTSYNGFGAVMQIKSFDYDNNKTVVQNISYDNVGLTDSVCNPYLMSGTSQDYSTPSWSNITTYHYDGLGRDTLIVHPDGEKIRKKHYGNVDTVLDEKGNKAIYKYNAFGSLDTVIDGHGNTTWYKYDILGRLTQVRDAETLDTKYYYDKLGRLIAMNCPDAKSSYTIDPDGDSVDVLYEYDDVGNVTRKKDANGWVDYEYDDIYRLVEIRHSTNQGSTWPDTIRFVYDVAASSPTPETLYVNPKGRLGKLITVGTDSISYYYDNLGNMTMKQISINGLQGTKSIKYEYNKAAQCTTLWATGVGYVAKYGYNSLGQLKNMPSFVSIFKYNPAGQITKINQYNSIVDTIIYDNRFRPILVSSEDPGQPGDDILKLRYAYQKNSNVDSIIDKLVSGNTQAFAYDSLNRLTKVTMAADTQTFTYDNVGNRTSKDGTNYTYYQNTNRLSQDHRSYTYDYDDNGNIIRHQYNSSTVDSFAYDWNNRLVYYKKGDETIDYAYNASGLRVKKHYRKKSEQAVGSGLQEASLDLGMIELGADTIYNKGRDMITVYSKDTSTYVNFRIVNQYLYDDTTVLNLYITLDIDTIANSGILTYPEDSMTRVPPEAAWEYCAYVEGDDYGLYDEKGTKDSQPFSMVVEKVPGDSGEIRIKIAKSLIGGPSVVRYTIATFDPDTINTDTQWQGGSSVCDVFPGTIETFGGTVNGYGEFSSTTLEKITEYTIYYVYDGINPIVEYSPNGSKLKHYVYAGSRHIARVAGANTHWYHVDALGSPRKMTDENGTVVWSATYLPFGEITKSGTDDNSHGFTGKELDENSLNYFCQRYYDPEIGRFMTLDRWTNLPDDERMFSYEKYVRWDNHRLNYEPHVQQRVGIHHRDVETSRRGKRDPMAYDTLQAALSSIYTHVSRPFVNPTHMLATHGRMMVVAGMMVPITFGYRHQVNRYLYCRNNPLRYIDPTGNGVAENKTLWTGIFGTCMGALWGIPIGLINPGLGIGVQLVASVHFGMMYDRYWDFVMKYGPEWEWSVLVECEFLFGDFWE